MCSDLRNHEDKVENSKYIHTEMTATIVWKSNEHGFVTAILLSNSQFANFNKRLTLAFINTIYYN